MWPLVPPQDMFPESGVVPGGAQPLKDWHNLTQERLDRLRSGPGEHGAPHHLTAGREKERDALFETNGFNALLSDDLALDRSLKDIRHPK